MTAEQSQTGPQGPRLLFLVVRGVASGGCFAAVMTAVFPAMREFSYAISESIFRIRLIHPALDLCAVADRQIMEAVKCLTVIPKFATISEAASNIARHHATAGRHFSTSPVETVPAIRSAATEERYADEDAGNTYSLLSIHHYFFAT